MPLAGVSFWKAENVKRTFLLFAAPGLIFTQPDSQASLVGSLVVNGRNTSSAECVHVTQCVLTDGVSLPSLLFVLLACPLAASAEPIYLRCDSKEPKGFRPSKGAIDLILNEAKGAVETRILGFDGYTDNANYGPGSISSTL